MSTDTTTRWTVTVSRETDITVRNLLARRGLKEDDLPGFIEETLKWRIFDRSLTEARNEFADLWLESLQDLVAEAT